MKIYRCCVDSREYIFIMDHSIFWFNRNDGKGWIQYKASGVINEEYINKHYRTDIYIVEELDLEDLTFILL